MESRKANPELKRMWEDKTKRPQLLQSFIAACGDPGETLRMQHKKSHTKRSTRRREWDYVKESDLLIHFKGDQVKVEKHKAMCRAKGTVEDSGSEDEFPVRGKLKVMIKIVCSLGAFCDYVGSLHVGQPCVQGLGYL